MAVDLYPEVRDLVESFRSDPRVGTYTFAGGQVTPAICYLPAEGFGYSFPPASTKITGCELVLIRTEESLMPYLGSIHGTDRVEVWIKSWGDSDEQRKSLAKELFFTNLCLDSEFRPASERLGSPNTNINTYILFEECY